MFTPSSLSIALLMMIASAVCWGSWANTFKGVKGYRFELFYWDYAAGIFLISLVLAFTMGSTGNDASSFLNNVRAADTSNIVNALIGGALFEFATGILNIQYAYLFQFFFTTAHYYGAWVFIAAFALHVALKLGTMRRALAARHGLAPLREGVAATRPEPRKRLPNISPEPA